MIFPPKVGDNLPGMRFKGNEGVILIIVQEKAISCLSIFYQFTINLLSISRHSYSLLSLVLTVSHRASTISVYPFREQATSM